MKFSIQRSGRSRHRSGTSSEKSCVDLTAQRALVNTKALAPLPAAYTERELIVRLRFDYVR